MENKEDRDIEINLLDLFRYYIKHLGVICLIIVIGAGSSFAVSEFILTPIYTSTSAIYVGSSGGGSVSSMLSALQIGSELTSDYRALATSRPVVDKLIDDFNLDIEYEDMCERINIDTPSGTRLMNLQVDDEDPDQAKAIVDELTEIMIQQAKDVMGMTEPVIIQNGDIPEDPSSPQIILNTLLGGLIALILVFCIYTFKYLSKFRIHTPEDIEKYLGLNNLGSIPMAAGTDKK